MTHRLLVSVARIDEVRWVLYSNASSPNPIHHQISTVLWFELLLGLVINQYLQVPLLDDKETMPDIAL
jgi:hypothetical protein